MGAVALQVDRTRGWIGPAPDAITSDPLVLISDGVTTAGLAGTVFLGDNSNPGAVVGNSFYLVPPVLPANRLPVQINTTLRLASSEQPTPGAGSLVTMQVLATADASAVAQTQFGVVTVTGADYVPNLQLAPTWPLDQLLIRFFTTSYVATSEMSFSLVYADPPSAHFTYPATNGTVLTATVRPLLQWQYLAGDNGGQQSAFRVLIYTQAQTTQTGFTAGVSQPTWDSGTVRSSLQTYAMPVNLKNTTTYVAYVMVAQSVKGVEQWSDGWATRTFTIQIPPAAVPAQPSITATADSANARIALTATQSSTPAWTHVIIERSRDAGATWEAIRSGDVDIAGGSTLTTWDYETGNGELVRYRATAEIESVAGGITQVSTSSPSLQTPFVSWTSAAIWLKDPLRPDLNQVIDVRGLPTQTRRNPRGIFDISGRARPVIVSDTRHAPEGTVVFATVTDAQTDAFNAVIDLADTLLLQFPPGWGWASQYVSLGDANEDRVVPEVAANQMRWHTMAYNVVDAPVGDFVGFITAPGGGVPIPGSVATWADVVAQNADWTTVVARYPTWFDLYGARTLTWAEMPVLGHWADVVSAYPDWNALLGVVASTGSHLLDPSGNFLINAAGNRLTI